MPVRSLPFFDGLKSGYEELAGAMPSMINLMPLADGLATRPVVSTWDDFPADSASIGNPVVSIAILGDRILFVTQDAVGERRVFAWVYPGTVVQVSSDADTSTFVGGTLRPHAISWRSSTLFAGGGQLLRVTTGLVATPVILAPIAGAVSIIAQRAIVAPPDQSGLFYWSDPGESQVELWDTTYEFREAEARPDGVVEVRETARELWVFGETSLQVYAPDPNETFAPVAALDVGCRARSSVVRYDNQMVWIDDRDRVVMSDGRTLPASGLISEAGIGLTIADFSTTTDAWSYREKTGVSDCIVITFPSMGRVFAYDVSAAKWSERRASAAVSWAPWSVRSHCYWPARKLNIVGLADGTLAVLTTNHATDNGAPMRFAARSGFVNSSSLVDPMEVRIVVRRGSGQPGDQFGFRWRDAPGDPWSNPIMVTLGEGEDSDPVVRIRPAGPPYRSRQWEIFGETASRIHIVSVQEVYEEIE